MPERKAYDQSRREFYRLRQEEEVERRIAVEEARYVGAYFGKTRLDVGMQLEDREYEKWKVWAHKETIAAEASQRAGVETFDMDEGPEDAESESVGEEPAGTTPDAPAPTAS